MSQNLTVGLDSDFSFYSLRLVFLFEEIQIHLLGIIIRTIGTYSSSVIIAPFSSIGSC